MSYPAPNNPQGLKGALVVAGSITANGTPGGPPTSSVVYTNFVQSKDALGGLNLVANAGQVRASPSIISTTPITLTASETLPALLALAPNTNVFCYAPLNAATGLLGDSPKLKCTVQWVLATDDANNNAFWECGIVIGQATGGGVQVPKTNAGVRYLAANTGITQPVASGNFAASSGSASIILTRGVDYTPGVNIAAFVATSANYPNSRVSSPVGDLPASMTLTLEPVY